MLHQVCSSHQVHRILNARMELERTHTQPRDPNTREHVIDNYGNNERGNNNDNLKQYAKNCIAESVTVQLGSL